MTRADRPTSLMTREGVLDTYFLEHRAKLIDLAAFLDRVDRAEAGGSSGGDHRLAALGRALAIVQDGSGERARRVLECFSDGTTEPLDTTPGGPVSGAPRAED